MAKKIKLVDPVPPPSVIDYLKIVNFRRETNVEHWLEIYVGRGNHVSYATCRVNVDTGTYPAGTLVAHVDGEPDDRFINVVDVVSTAPGQDVDGVLFRSESGGTVEAPNNQLTEIAEPVSGWNSITNSPPGGGGAAETQWEEWAHESSKAAPLFFRIEDGMHPARAGMSLRRCPSCAKWFTVETECDEPGCSGEPTLPYDGYTRLATGNMAGGADFDEKVTDTLNEFLTSEEVPDPDGAFPTYDQAVLIDADLESS